ncbi:MAG: hypothetical protein NVS9B10_15770 [Nevskia sp.]
MNVKNAKAPRRAASETPTGLTPGAVRDVSGALNVVLADLFLRTKNFHWHISGAHVRDYHRLLYERSAQNLATTDVVAERVRKIGAMDGAKAHFDGVVAFSQKTYKGLPHGMCRTEPETVNADLPAFIKA